MSQIKNSFEGVFRVATEFPLILFLHRSASTLVIQLERILSLVTLIKIIAIHKVPSQESYSTGIAQELFSPTIENALHAQYVNHPPDMTQGQFTLVTILFPLTYICFVSLLFFLRASQSQAARLFTRRTPKRCWN